MAHGDQQPNTARRRSEILDAEYIPREEAPNLPRVHYTPPSAGRVSALAVVTVVIALLAVAVAVTRGGDAFPGRRKGPVILTAETGSPAAKLRPCATEAPVPAGEAGLGVAAETVRAPVAEYYTMKDCPLVPGAQVYALDEDGPGAAAGLETGDVITAVDRQPVLSAADLCRAEARRRPGETVELTVFRRGEYLTLEAELAPPTPEDEDDFFHTVDGS